MALATEKKGLRESPDDSSVDASPIRDAAQEVSSNIWENEAQETVKSLTEKLATALLNISAKEDLVKQHSKVAEEAVSGWEKAETEVAVLKQQLEATSQKNSDLEDRVSHLDGALKECVRQLRQLRDEHEQKVHTLTKKTQEWESNKSELENQLMELKAQLEASKAEVGTILTANQSKLEAIEKENAELRAKLLNQSEELKIRTLEGELSTQAAETASKQHLESIKKVAKLEAECRKLRAFARKTSPANDHKAISSSVCAESLTDSQSDNGDRLLGADNELSGSDSWASALIAELDQFKNEKAGTKVLRSSISIDLMDDFLEMEKLAAMPETDHGSPALGLEIDYHGMACRDNPSKVGDEVMKQKMVELEETVGKLETEKAKLEMALADFQNKLEISCNQLTIAEGKLVQLQQELELAKESKQAAMEEAAVSDAKRKELESQLESTLLEVNTLHDKIVSLEGKEAESVLSSELKTRLEASEAAREAVESQLRLAYAEVERLRKEMGLLEANIEEERTLSAELAAKVDTAETRRKAMESQYLSAELNIRNLQEKVSLLGHGIEDERSLSAELASKIEAVEGARKELECELKVAHSEIRKLRSTVGLLEEEVDNERTLSTQFAMKCRTLEDEVSKKRQEAELRALSCSNGDLTLKQEKELAVAAEKLAECQKTIASLGRQLKSLSTLDEFMLETEQTELKGGSPNDRSGSPLGDAGSCTRSGGKERGSPPSQASSTSMLSGFGRLLSRSRSSSRVENQ